MHKNNIAMINADQTSYWKQDQFMSFLTLLHVFVVLKLRMPRKMDLKILK